MVIFWEPSEIPTAPNPLLRDCVGGKKSYTEIQEAAMSLTSDVAAFIFIHHWRKGDARVAIFMQTGPVHHSCAVFGVAGGPVSYTHLTLPTILAV